MGVLVTWSPADPSFDVRPSILRASVPLEEGIGFLASGWKSAVSCAAHRSSTQHFCWNTALLILAQLISDHLSPFLEFVSVSWLGQGKDLRVSTAKSVPLAGGPRWVWVKGFISEISRGPQEKSLSTSWDWLLVDGTLLRPTRSGYGQK